MNQLKNLVEKNPQLQSNKSEYLKLAIKLDGGGVKGTGPHSVKLVGCENATNQDYKTRQPIKGVHLLFEEGGVQKKYFVPILGDDGKFHYLIERFAGIEEGSELILEYKRKEGSVRGFIDVQPAGTGIEVKDNDIPVVEEDEIRIEDIPF